jgi:7,8-dihydropterin-6-yl-methyl-4-(beta-D-ribofuranosyl)aminobenzene 5'-phosphate synthase
MGSRPPETDERYLAVNVKGKGLIVFSACSHAGIVNVMHAVQADIPGVPIHTVMGGFHLAGGSEARIGATVSDLAQFEADLFMPGHFTGWRAVNALHHAFGEKVVFMAVGMTIRL